jgi:heme A synthase
MNDEQGSDASREEPGSMPWAAVASVVLVANSIFAGLGSLYTTTNSIAVVVVAAILLSVLAVVIVWARTRRNR